MDHGGDSLHTIGHSTHDMEHLLQLLRGYHIDVIVDVRSSPYSKYTPQFNRKELRQSVREAGMQYLYLGNLLGGYPDRPEFYDDAGHVMYDRLAVSKPFLDGIKRLRNGIERYKVALLCSEEEPAHCHRHLLIARVLVDQGVAVAHIRGDGSVESAQLPVDAEQMTLFGGEDDHSVWRSYQAVAERRLR